MRINQFVAQSTGMSRREADKAIELGSVQVNGQPVKLGQQVTDSDFVTHNGAHLSLKKFTTILLNKPIGYVCSRDGQGSKTIYDLLPKELHHLKPVGRLDKDSSGLLLLTNDGQLAQGLAHPKHQKQKMYRVALDAPLAPDHWHQLIGKGVELEDGVSTFDELRWIDKNDGYTWMVVLHEGRNRQIRRTFEMLGYKVTHLHRTKFGDYELGSPELGKYRVLK